jgi:hypothetical protein
MSLDASCLCVITSQNAYLLNLPYLGLLQTLSNPLISFLSQSQEDLKQTPLDTKILHQGIESSQQNASYTPFQSYMTFTSAIPSHQSMKKILYDIQKHNISSFQLSTPLAVFVMQCPNTLHLKGIWFCHKQPYEYTSSSKPLDPVSYSLVNPSKSLHDNLFILKQQVMSLMHIILLAINLLFFKTEIILGKTKIVFANSIAN